MYGSGREVPSCLIRGFVQWKERSENTTVNSCPVSSYCAAVPVSLRKITCGRLTETFLHRMLDGNSLDCDWRRTRNARYSRLSALAAGTISSGCHRGAVEEPQEFAVPLVIRRARLGAVRRNHAVGRILSDARRDGNSARERGRDGRLRWQGRNPDRIWRRC